jgi:hypothetical protein
MGKLLTEFWIMTWRPGIELLGELAVGVTNAPACRELDLFA